MRQYSNNKNYNPILESMAQIRKNQLNEMHGGMKHLMAGHGGMKHLMAAHGGMHSDEEEMEEGMHGDEEEMEEGMHKMHKEGMHKMHKEGMHKMHKEGMHGDEEEMEEGMYEGEHEDDEDAQMEALAEMMDEALMELDQEDDEDQMLGEEEEDGDRLARRRARLRNALLIGAGIVATGGLGAAAAMGKLPGAFGQQTMKMIGNKIGDMSKSAAADELISKGQSMIDRGMEMAKGEFYTNPMIGKIRGFRGTGTGR